MICMISVQLTLLNQYVQKAAFVYASVKGQSALTDDARFIKISRCL